MNYHPGKKCLSFWESAPVLVVVKRSGFAFLEAVLGIHKFGEVCSYTVLSSMFSNTFVSSTLQVVFF